MRRYSAPGLVILSRAAVPPIPSNDATGHTPKQELQPDQLEGDKKLEGNKKELRGRSKASSLNLAKVLSATDWKRHGKCLHCTLTYWHEWPKTKDELALAKQALVMSLSRKCECGIWSLEYQTKRAEKHGGQMVPHWHVLLWIADRDPEAFEDWLRQWWAKFSENSSPYGVHVTSGDQARGTWYLAMHSAKAAQSSPFAVGRWWGYINRDKLLEAQDLQTVGMLTDRESVWWARMFRRSLRCKVRQRGRCAQGLSWFLPRGAQCDLAAWIRDQIEAEKFSRTRRDGPGGGITKHTHHRAGAGTCAGTHSGNSNK